MVKNTDEDIVSSIEKRFNGTKLIVLRQSLVEKDITENFR